MKPIDRAEMLIEGIAVLALVALAALWMLGWNF